MLIGAILGWILGEDFAHSRALPAYEAAHEAAIKGGYCGDGPNDGTLVWLLWKTISLIPGAALGILAGNFIELAILNKVSLYRTKIERKIAAIVR
jgi:hypothetical protein